MTATDYLIVGAGPTGIGAALRLRELDRPFLLLEAGDNFGGLARSVKDEEGFTWDIGGHVQFSHYRRFDEYMDLALAPDQWLNHERESWVRICDRFVPYPFQQNLHRLPKEERWNCVRGLLELSKEPRTAPKDFKDWIEATFGRGIADIFMLPYNLKVWAYPPEMMSAHWIGERVAVPPLEGVLRSVCLGEDQVSWGPNALFRFPKFGGTGAIWRSLGARIPSENLCKNTEVVAVDAKRKTAVTKDGEQIKYRYLISTMPLDLLLRMVNGAQNVSDPGTFRYSGTHVIGVGLEGQPPDELATKCWMYFPEDDCPFYRVTVFSNYSPYNTPEPESTWSLMAEVSESEYKRVDHESVVDDTLRGMYNTGLISRGQKIRSTWHSAITRGYPTPFLNRDRVLEPVLRLLEKDDIYSRGRFGAWKYEVSNQDHSFMQGIEVVDRIVSQREEETLNSPDLVNSRTS